MARQLSKRAGTHSGGGGANGGGGKRGIPVRGWEKGDIVRNMVIQSGDPGIPRKPGSRRDDQTISVAGPAKETSEPKSDSRRPDATVHVLVRAADVQRWSERIERLGSTKLLGLQKKHSGLERISIRLEDANGPRGGLDKLCRIKAVVKGRPSQVVEHKATTAMPAVRGALKLLERLLAEKSSRRVSWHRGDRKPREAAVSNLDQ